MSRTIEEVRDFVAADRGLAVVSLARPNGSVHSSVVNAGVMTHPLTGQEVVALVALGGSWKLRHWRSHPRATIVFRSGWMWIGVEGEVTIIGPDDPAIGFDTAQVPTLLREVFTAAGGTHDDWDTYDQVMAEERRAAVFITPNRITGVGQPG